MVAKLNMTRGDFGLNNNIEWDVVSVMVTSVYCQDGNNKKN